MNCDTAKEKMALHVGGDLPEREVVALTVHIAGCRDCAAELAALRRMQSVVGDMADVEPPPLPGSFSARVMAQTAVTAGERTRPRGFGWLQLGWMPVTAVGALVVVFLVSVWLFSDHGGVSDTAPVVMWGDLAERYGAQIGEPVLLAQWEPPDAPGVFMIMHRPDPQGAPDAYCLDYCGERARFGSYRSSPWTWQRERRLMSRVGSPQNVYIVVITLPGSSWLERRSLETTLIEEYNPHFNIRNGV